MRLMYTTNGIILFTNCLYLSVYKSSSQVLRYLGINLSPKLESKTMVKVDDLGFILKSQKIYKA
jgi:hypothetical protein